ncbi:CobW family GTP-binding protein [Neptunomonas antarctica]|uniref:GTPase, G3E family n=1 Tax=Neptunomonas antarctica TaxID=619304 RepID=A0A1N7M165_9GAMM|nr:GTP-binding protein [Neptunomonas antarctica]SIS79803.1 GTPase, G3E family [Neptunomonas antarctica]
MLSNIPTNIITGFLGVGKTTALNQLIKQKPENETWAIVVNEFGQIGIDQSVLTDQTGIQIKEIAGGCICCALGPALTISLAMLLRRTRPDRVIIEPTGLGHPEGLIDILQSESFREVLTLRSIICLLDPRVLEQPEVLRHQTFIDQLNLADIIALNKCDLATTAQVNEAQTLSENMFPPKQKVIQIIQGEFPIQLLDHTRNTALSAHYPDAHSNGSDPQPLPQQLSKQASKQSPPQPPVLPALFLPEPGKPIKRTGANQEAFSCGWVFHPDDQFDHDSLLAYLNSLTQIWRLKGVFRIGHSRVFYNRVLDETTTQPIAWRRDSRLEIISQTPLAWHEIETALLSMIKK